jgi:hypothetical protein
MSDYTLPARSIPLNDNYDVIVLGGGPAGCTAAAAAAREGLKTLLVETTGMLGGMGTAALVPAWCYFSDQNQMIYRGLAAAVFHALKATMPHVPADQLDWVPINAEKLKVIYDNLVTSNGATVLFNSMMLEVMCKADGVVDVILIGNKDGLTAYRAKAFIDCSGDADLVFRAGGKTVKGDEKTGALQPATHCFILGNVDEYAYRTMALGVEDRREIGTKQETVLHNLLKAAMKRGEFPDLPDAHVNNHLVAPRTVAFNAGHVRGVDSTNPASVSKALMEGRRIAHAFRDALAKIYPEAFGSAFLAQTGTLLGTRESRRIVGDYTITIEDYTSRASFPDEIGRNSYYIDVHGGVHMPPYAPGESHGIPYRSLTPVNLKNVIIAGRSASCDRVVLGSLRVMPNCLVMGEAAGVATAFAVRDADCDYHKVNTEALRARLKEHGAYLP